MQKTLIQPKSWRQPMVGMVGPNERCVELPLAVGFMQLQTPGEVLDAGCALNQNISGDLQARLTHVTQSFTRENRYVSEKRRYVVGDLRDLSMFADKSFDRVLCISTLEHVGCDNSRYCGPIENCPETVALAAQELWRVCGGGLLISVPFRLEYWRERGWQYITPESLESIRCGGDVVYFRKAEDASWSGPFDEPTTTSFDDEPWRPSQIAVIFACR